MRTQFGYAWGKLYQATLEMATSPSPLPQRVTTVFRQHLGSLNSQNLPPDIYERMKVIRSRLAGISEDLDEDVTVSFAPITAREAALIAEEIFSLYDEIARTDARSRPI